MDLIDLMFQNKRLLIIIIFMVLTIKEFEYLVALMLEENIKIN